MVGAASKDRIRTLGPPLAGLKEHDISIPVRDGSTLPSRVYSRDQNQITASSILVSFHGGGYCIGMADDDAETNRRLAMETDLVVVSVGYRLAPEYPFPACVEDGYDALQWLAKNSTTLGAEHSARFIVGGTSSGGNVAMAVVYLNRDMGAKTLIHGMFLSASNMIPPPVVPEKYKSQLLSMEENREHAIPDPALVQLFMGAYKPDLTSPLFVPFNHPDGHTGIPPTYFQICGLDVLRDEELLYEKLLREDRGIPTRVDFYAGLPHHFWEFFPQLAEQNAKRLEDTVAGFKWLLNQRHGN